MLWFLFARWGWGCGSSTRACCRLAPGLRDVRRQPRPSARLARGSGEVRLRPRVRAGQHGGALLGGCSRTCCSVGRHRSVGAALGGCYPLVLRGRRGRTPQAVLRALPEAIDRLRDSLSRPFRWMWRWRDLERSRGPTLRPGFGYLPTSSRLVRSFTGPSSTGRIPWRTARRTGSPAR